MQRLCNITGLLQTNVTFATWRTCFKLIANVMVSFVTWVKYYQAGVEVMLLSSAGPNVVRLLKKSLFPFIHERMFPSCYILYTDVHRKLVVQWSSTLTPQSERPTLTEGRDPSGYRFNYLVRWTQPPDKGGEGSRTAWAVDWMVEVS